MTSFVEGPQHISKVLHARIPPRTDDYASSGSDGEQPIHPDTSTKRSHARPSESQKPQRESVERKHVDLDSKGVCSLFEQFCEFLAKILIIVDCRLTSEHLIECAKKFGNQIILNGKKIDLSCNDIGLEGIGYLGEMLSNSKSRMEELKLRRCALNDEKLQKLIDQPELTMIDTLDLSDNHGLSEKKACQNVMKLVKKVDASSLAIRNCRLRSADELLNASCDLKITHLDLSENTFIDPRSVGKLAVQLTVKELILRNCKHSAEDLSNLCDELQKLHNNKMDLIDVRDWAVVLTEEKTTVVHQLELISTKVLYKL